jgi:hypothetical protein
MRQPEQDDYDTPEDFEDAWDDYMSYCEDKYDEMRDDLLTEGL